MRILFCGGETLGPVTPLLAVAEELNAECRMQNAECKLIWIGTKRGPERKLIEEAGISFSWIWAPKWRRYFDVRNFFVLLQFALAAVWAWVLLLKLSFGRGTTRKLSFERQVIVTAGGFVGVPVVLAGWFLRIPSVLHNQDVRWSLANKLVAPFVKKITFALPGTVPARWKEKSVWTGNPIRQFILHGEREKGLKFCGFSDRMPTILVVGGGTGAKRLNEIVAEALPELTRKYQVIHVAGIGKKLSFGPDGAQKLSFKQSCYCAFEFVATEMGNLLAAADLVITRAGMGFLTELAARSRPMVIVPIPGSHQEDNARYFEKKGAAVLLNQRTLDGNILFEAIDRLFHELGTMQEMAERAGELSKPNAASKIADEIVGLAKK